MIAIHILPKIFKGASNDISIEDSAMHPRIKKHLFSLDKDKEFLIYCHFFKESRN